VHRHAKIRAKKKNKKDSQSKSKKTAATSKKTAATSKKTAAVKPAPKPKKQPPPDDGGGWVTAGAKKKKKQPRGGGGYNPNAKQEEFSTYAIPTAKIGILIGPKGKTLREIEEKSGCKIKLPDSRNSSRKETTVTITGQAAGRSVAKAVMKDIVELGFSPKLIPGMKMHGISVSVSLLPMLRGNKFAKLKALEEDGNVKISIPDPKGGAKSVRLKVAGTMRGIEKAKKNLAQLNLYYHCEATHPGYVHQVVYNCDLALLVGPRGQTIKSIQGDTKAKIFTPKSGSANKNVVIVGSKASVQKALKQVQRLTGSDVKTLTTKGAPPPVDDDFFMEESYE